MNQDRERGCDSGKHSAGADSLSENTITTILGRKGMGKSTLARELMLGEPRVVVLDTMGGYGDTAEVVWERDECIQALLDASKKRRFQLALRVVEQEDMLDILDMCWELTDYLLVIEETSLVCGTPPYLNRELGVLVRYGRHRRISQIYIARRPTELPRDLTAQSDLIVTFQQRELRDLQYLQASGFDARQVYALPPYRVCARGDGALPLSVVKRLKFGFDVQREGLTVDDESVNDSLSEPEEATEG
jgi:hypothetical protein